MVSTVDRLTAAERLGEEERWQAILTRDARLDGAFVYAVRSTFIYCRPSCPSRKPQREQVVFLPVPEVAEQMGFRPCRRCRPHEYPSDDSQLVMVRSICRYINENPDGIPTLEQMGAHAGISPHHLQKVFKRLTGITPRDYADACRLGNLKARLREGWKVTDALYESGYGSSSRLYEKASIQLGMTPATYRRRGQGLQIAYTIAGCSLGLLMVASTGRGVCFVSLGDEEPALEGALRSEYPAAEICRDDATMKEWVQALLRLLAGRLPQPGLPLDLDIMATSFQRMVWEHLKLIPIGETRSYSEIARAIGRPKAARAVARACASNPVALVIPCHRAVPKDGGTGGYRWGVERKEALLAQEQSVAREEAPLRPVVHCA